MPREPRLPVAEEWKPATLTEREIEVVELVRLAYTNKEIGVALRISQETVKRHLTNVFDKLGCFSRMELLVRTGSKDWLREQLLARKQELIAMLASVDAKLEAGV